MGAKLVAMSLMGLCAATAAHAADFAALRSITVSGHAERKVVPDEAHMVVNLNSMDKELATAKAAHDGKLQKLMGIVKKAGIDEKKVATQSSTTEPVYRYRTDAKNNNVQELEGYRVQTQVDITVGDTAKLSGLIQSITGAGFEQGARTEWGNLLSTSYTLSNPDRLREDLLVAALGNAQAKAARMATAAGASLGPVYQISEGNSPAFAPVPMMRMAAMAEASVASAAAMAPPAGEQEIQTTVSVTYELK